MVLELTSRLEAQKATGHKQDANYVIKAQGRYQVEASLGRKSPGGNGTGKRSL